jgi:hypothetical protein
MCFLGYFSLGLNFLRAHSKVKCRPHPLSSEMSKRTNSYRHIKPEDRKTSSSLIQQNYIHWYIAKLLGSSASSIGSELERNAWGKCYDSQSVQRNCQHRRIASRRKRKLHTESIFLTLCTPSCAHAGRTSKSI